MLPVYTLRWWGSVCNPFNSSVLRALSRLQEVVKRRSFSAICIECRFDDLLGMVQISAPSDLASGGNTVPALRCVPDRCVTYQRPW